MAGAWEREYALLRPHPGSERFLWDRCSGGVAALNPRLIARTPCGVGRERGGITSDPNREDDPEYIVRLVGQVVRVSLETVKIVGGLPGEFEPGGDEAGASG